MFIFFFLVSYFVYLLFDYLSSSLCLCFICLFVLLFFVSEPVGWLFYLLVYLFAFPVLFNILLVIVLYFDTIVITQTLTCKSLIFYLFSCLFQYLVISHTNLVLFISLMDVLYFRYIYYAQRWIWGCSTSKMECFVIIVNGFQQLTIITKHSISDVAAALDPLLMLSLSFSSGRSLLKITMGLWFSEVQLGLLQHPRWSALW